MIQKQRIVILNPTCLEVLDAQRAYLDATGLEWVAAPDFMSVTPARGGGGDERRRCTDRSCLHPQSAFG